MRVKVGQHPKKRPHVNELGKLLIWFQNTGIGQRGLRLSGVHVARMQCWKTETLLHLSNRQQGGH